MSANDYHFVTRWRVQSTVEEVSEVLGDARDLARWRPSLAVNELEPGGKEALAALWNHTRRAGCPTPCIGFFA
jgi:hypothetical protein